MSREIKFRVWDKACNCMYLPEDNRNSKFYFNGSYSIEGTWCAHNEIEIMQYTGLKDKNGREIYEGDILAVDNQTVNFLVEYRNGGFCTSYSNLAKQKRYTLLTDASDEVDVLQLFTPEVIGNKWENAELLENA